MGGTIDRVAEAVRAAVTHTDAPKDEAPRQDSDATASTEPAPAQAADGAAALSKHAGGRASDSPGATDQPAPSDAPGPTATDKYKPPQVPDEPTEPETLQIEGPGSGSFTPPEDTTHVQMRINVDSTSGDGLNFFGLQVNFDNETWAHGGVQRTDGDRKVNWGGLPVRNDGNSDYTEPSDEQKLRELDRIQNGENQVEEVDWDEDTEYIYEITRGDKVTVPAGEARVSHSEDPVDVDHDREMYEWNFTVRPADGGEPIYEGTMYNTAESIEWVALWNETGYGADEDATRATWGDFQVGGDDGDLHPVPLDGHTGGAGAGDAEDLATDPPPPEDDRNIFEKAWDWAFG